jgi:uncharacterized protein (DUF1684 family)
MKKVNISLLFVMIASLLKAQTYNDDILAHREKYKQDFLTEERSPLKKDEIQYLRFYDPDENYKVKSTFVKTENAVPFDMATMNGKTKKYVEYGTLTFVLDDKLNQLRVYQSIALLENPEYKEYLFLPFTDETNGDETYIGGRYLDLKTGDIKDGLFTLDFNKAYNPYCAFSDGYSCPKPPKENELKLKVLAGEKNFGKKH